MIRSKLLPLALAASVVAPTIATTAAQAAVKNPQADQAMRKGIRDVARLEGNGAKATHIKIRCVAVPKVNDKKPCSGTFDLVKDGKTAHYVLTAKARTFRISPGAIEYRVNAKATNKVAGLPAKTDLLGFLQ
jgi:multidrug efflux pump subunit AcrA (membrane-fusion protein)